MGTLWSELGPVAESVSDRPRVYADANVPAGLVAFMRDKLRWDVLSVMEHPDLRRARDSEHYRLARQLRRTLITLDRDYLDDRAFPPQSGSGVLVIAAPDERGLAALLARLDAHLFAADTLPLDGRKLHAHSDWSSADYPDGKDCADEPR
jgi:predicted nuclease of predicted toxin-antitoxin system